MEKMQEINKKIAKNLTSCRKAAGLTQAELAEKINYSDKSVSKWAELPQRISGPTEFSFW